MPLRGVDREGVQGVNSEVEADWLLRTLRSVTCTSLVASSVSIYGKSLSTGQALVV